MVTSEDEDQTSRQGKVMGPTGGTKKLGHSLLRCGLWNRGAGKPLRGKQMTNNTPCD